MLSARSAKLNINDAESHPSQLSIPSQPDAGTDVVMLSAKTEPPASVDMKSANTDQTQQQQALLGMSGVKNEAEVRSEIKVEPVDTKALIKEAILKAGLRKQQLGKCHLIYGR